MHRGRKHKQQGGYLDGPAHEYGGIPAVIAGGEEVELEGGEYIINAQTVDALGTEFLDKINSTQTTYHTGGFEAGELPNPSMYAKGGKIRRNNMRRRKYTMGGRPRRNCPDGMTWINGQCMNVTPPPPPPGGRRSMMRVGGRHKKRRWHTSDPMFTQRITPSYRGGGNMTAVRGVDQIPFCAHPANANLPQCAKFGKMPPAPIKWQRGGNIPYITGAYNNPYRRGGLTRRRKFSGGGMTLGAPNSCIDGRGRNVHC